MNLFSILSLQDSRLTPESLKVHLASHNGIDDPLRVYFAGKFDDWQSWQTKRNFTRPFLVSLIRLPERNRWLYVGSYAVNDVVWVDQRKEFRYSLEVLPACAELGGRMVIDFERSGRAAYVLGETFGPKMSIHELRPERMHLQEFPGFKRVDLEWQDLEAIVRQNVPSWRTVLSNVAGVYLVTDPVGGKLYVGSATGEGGIWVRWSQYVDGHGNNIELLRLIKEFGRQRAAEFRFSILEIADVNASREEVLERESHWKRVLLSRTHGYNAN